MEVEIGLFNNYLGSFTYLDLLFNSSIFKLKYLRLNNIYDKKEIVGKTATFVCSKLEGEGSGHDIY